MNQYCLSTLRVGGGYGKRDQAQGGAELIWMSPLHHLPFACGCLSYQEVAANRSHPRRLDLHQRCDDWRDSTMLHQG